MERARGFSSGVKSEKKSHSVEWVDERCQGSCSAACGTLMHGPGDIVVGCAAIAADGSLNF
jgi:hypothetical protein